MGRCYLKAEASKKELPDCSSKQAHGVVELNISQVGLAAIQPYWGKLLCNREDQFRNDVRNVPPDAPQVVPHCF